MTWFQRVVLGLMPAAWAKAAEAETRTWVMRCPKCAHDESLWDAGGIRWGARGKTWAFRRCAQCRAWAWQKLVRKY